VIARPSYELSIQSEEGRKADPSTLQFDVIEVTSPQRRRQPGVVNNGDVTDDVDKEESSLLIGFNSGRFIKWSYKLQKQHEYQLVEVQQQRIMGSSAGYCIAKHCRTIKLVDDKRFIVLGGDSLVLYTLANDSELEKRVIHQGFHRSFILKLWSVEQQGDRELLVAICEGKPSRLRVWRLRDCSLIRDIPNVENIFDGGLYSYRIPVDPRLLSIGNISKDLMSPTSNTIPTFRSYDPQLAASTIIELHDGGFAMTGWMAVSLWSKDGRCLKSIYGTVGEYRTLLKMRSRRGFLTGGLYDKAVCGWTEDGDCLFICKTTECNDVRYELSNGLIVIGDVTHLQLWDPYAKYIIFNLLFDEFLLNLCHIR